MDKDNGNCPNIGAYPVGKVVHVGKVLLHTDLSRVPGKTKRTEDRSSRFDEFRIGVEGPMQEGVSCACSSESSRST